jgi:hypothetical protein
MSYLADLFERTFHEAALALIANSPRVSPEGWRKEPPESGVARASPAHRSNPAAGKPRLIGVSCVLREFFDKYPRARQNGQVDAYRLLPWSRAAPLGLIQRSCIRVF